ncbi:hypothetical protein FisN_23Hu264 [Fistulifera solaris]|uniref:FAD-binding FR-type domain-containing protein n=1 Tax=Fistulifera solaris TaxID=1519565 RepID=A0A1Z5JWG4_FISSO|nr:hypothetical protein FisN_23Hu264 [Fistulifera solaris]|eukprot:GAX18370.1 hypothetical protein FisN_23Hu264 [Fistulifera solaris]
MHNYEEMDEWSDVFIGIIAPVAFATCACSLLLTTHRLPTWRCSWVQRIAAALRRHPSTRENNNDIPSIPASMTQQFKANFWFFVSSLRLPFRSMSSDALYGYELASKKVNQFSRGEPDFNMLSFACIFLPIMIGLLAYMPVSIAFADEKAAMFEMSVAKLRLEGVSYLYGYGSIVCLSLFLIPVTRHSVLLAAMGWSPIHALRMHIWFGYMSFIFMFIHGILLVPVWFIYDPYPVYQQFIPDARCWTLTWTESTENDIQPSCSHVYANLSGLVAAIFYFVLWGSSLNWVRRRNYRLFYSLHVSFGTLALLGITLHMYWFVIYFIPSFTYYLASTTPTLVQAIASRFRGGVKIRKVVLVEDSGGCVEVQIKAHQTAHAVLDREPCQYIKLCVPKISLIWHPFDVFKSYSADGTADDTVRFLFRPVGPFTKELAKRLTSDVERPVTLVDGFYLGADNSELALQHDCVTMVAGGVALSPYLTLIPALLSRIALAESVGDNVKTKSIVLHWVVREPGLCRHYVQSYLSNILKRAKILKLESTLAIYVYLTGSEKALGDSSEIAAAVEPSISIRNPSSNEEKVVNGIKESPGHPLELPRMLPRRYAEFRWNIPYFVFYTAVTVAGVVYLFDRTPQTVMNYYELSEMTWIVLYAVFMFVGFSFIAETCVLCLRNFWPQPVPDMFEVVATDEKMKELSASDDVDVTVIESGNPSDANVIIAYRQGRPTSDQIFKDARGAAEPGIFMCGPSALTQMVKAEASKENSYLGLTRYCLYDEPYEM